MHIHRLKEGGGGGLMFGRLRIFSSIHSDDHTPELVLNASLQYATSNYNTCPMSRGSYSGCGTV